MLLEQVHGSQGQWGGGLNGREVEVLKGIGGGDTGGGTQRCLIIAMGESQETQDAGQTQEAGGLDPLLPSPPPLPHRFDKVWGK